MVSGVLALIIYEREQKRNEAIANRFEAMKHRHEAELLIQEADSKVREVLLDKERRREFLRRINHDLKAPLTVINWNLSKLRHEGIRSANAEEKVERLVKTSDRLYDLIAELTKTYDADANIEEQDLVNTTCDLRKLLETCVNMGQSLAEMSGSAVELGLIPEGARALFEPVALSRVIDNLVKNAIVHNSPGIRIILSVESSSSQFHVIRVSDNGKGIPPQHLSRIFEAEYRINPSDGKGTGLGLDIVKTLVEKTGGHVTLASKVGIGTTFLVAVRSSKEAPIDIPTQDDFDFAEIMIEGSQADRNCKTEKTLKGKLTKKILCALSLLAALAVIPTVAPHASGSNIESAQRLDTSTYMATVDGTVLNQDGTLNLQEGTMLISCKEKVKLWVRDVEVSMAKGAIVLIKSSTASSIVRNLNDRHWGSVSVSVKPDHWVHVGVGQEVMIGPVEGLKTKGDDIGRRAVKITHADEKKAIRFADICLQDNLVNEPLLIHARSHADGKPQQKLVEDLIKTTAICNLLTRTKGPFYRGVH